MKPPIRFRNNIPFFYDKSSDELRQDSYENYDSVVTRQCMIHLVDHLWDTYPMQIVLDYFMNNLPDNCEHILEIGCGVGRVIGTIAQKYPTSNCWGIDYSYQMLKKAVETYVDGENSLINLSRFGYGNISVDASKLSNVQFGLAKGEDLPFADNSQDFICSSFLIDRLSDLEQGFLEMKRVLRPQGTITVITPLNFVKAGQWTKYFPAVKLWKILQDMGFDIVDWQDDMIIKEPMDARGNLIQWKCVGMCLKLDSRAMKLS